MAGGDDILCLITLRNLEIHLVRAVHRYPVPAPYRIPLRKIPVNTVSDFNGMLIGILQNNTTNGGPWLSA